MELTKDNNIFKLSASLYSMNSYEYSQNDILLHIIKCNFIAMNNNAMQYDEIEASVLENYQITITTDELTSLTKNYAASFVVEGEKESTKICLTAEEEYKTRLSIEGGIDKYIDLYVETLDNKEQAKHYIYTYLYKLTVTNINTYQLLLAKVQAEELDPSALTVESKDFSESAAEIIRGFLDWNNDEKNRAISDLIMCCLEYCLCIARYDTSRLMKEFIEGKTLYLDTNIIFRAIGINGPQRKMVVNAFLKKCQEANLQLSILDCTEKEFMDTINYHIDKIHKTPRGNINSSLYLELSDYNIYTFYNDWSVKHPRLTLRYFNNFLISQFKTLCRQYGIKKETFIQTQEDVVICEEYIKKLGKIKYELSAKYVDMDGNLLDQNAQIQHDAKMVRYVEKKREQEIGVQSYIISSDKWLRYWAMQKTSADRAVVLFPSQFFLILIKLCGRAQDDLKSFVSFINIRHKTQQISPSKANVILSAISSVTEDIRAQTDIVEAILGHEFEEVIYGKIEDSELYEQVKMISENFLREELQKKEEEIAIAIDVNVAQKEKIEYLENVNVQSEGCIKEQNRKMYDMAKKATRGKFILSWWGLPILCVCVVAVFIFFVLCQLFWRSAEWNFVVGLIEWFNKTLLGENFGGAAVYIMDAAMLPGIIMMFKKYMKNPFNKNRRDEYERNLINTYLEKI